MIGELEYFYKLDVTTRWALHVDYAACVCLCLWMDYSFAVWNAVVRALHKTAMKHIEKWGGLIV